MTPEELFEDNQHLIYFTIKKYFGGKDRVTWSIKQNGMDWEDLEQTAKEALWISCMKFDVSKGVKFMSFAIFYIQAHIKGQIRSTGYLLKFPQRMPFTERNRYKIKSAETTVSHDGEVLVNLIEDENDYASYVITEVLIEQLSETLKGREKEAFMLKMQGLESKEIARQMGSSQNVIRSYYARAIKKVRGRIG